MCACGQGSRGLGTASCISESTTIYLTDCGQMCWSIIHLRHRDGAVPTVEVACSVDKKYKVATYAVTPYPGLPMFGSIAIIQ